MGLEDAMKNKADREMHAVSHTCKMKYKQELAKWGGWKINDGRVDLVCILYENSEILDWKPFICIIKCVSIKTKKIKCRFS